MDPRLGLTLAPAARVAGAGTQEGALSIDLLPDENGLGVFFAGKVSQYPALADACGSALSCQRSELSEEIFHSPAILFIVKVVTFDPTGSAKN